MAGVRLRFLGRALAAVGKASAGLVRPAARMVLAAMVVATGGYGLAHAAGRGLTKTASTFSSPTLRSERAQWQYFDCLQRELHDVVPRNVDVFVSDTNDASYVRLTELATPWARPVTVQSQAGLVISFGTGPAPPHCSGVTVVTRSP